MMKRRLTLTVLAVAVTFLAGPMAANAEIIASQDFTGDTALGDSNWGLYNGTTFVLDTVDEEIDLDKPKGAIAGGAWNLAGSGENISADLANGKVFSYSFDVRINSFPADPDEDRIEIRIGNGDTNSNTKMINFRLSNDGTGGIEVNPREKETSVQSNTGFALDVYHHFDVVVNRSGATLGNYDPSATLELLAGQADIWVNGDLVVLGIDLDGWEFGTSTIDKLLIQSAKDKFADASFDNFEIRDEPYVASYLTELVWRPGLDGNWATENWTPDFEASWVTPTGGEVMIVDSPGSVVNVFSDAAPAESLNIGETAGGTVDISASGALTVADLVTVGASGTLIAQSGGALETPSSTLRAPQRSRTVRWA